jgi:zinc finger FYVE domain-containing protein 26
MIRDEFSYDESPSISLCLDIMDFHTPNDEIAKFLVFHCYRLELLLRPIRGRINPEVDIILVAKMMKSLSLAAKVHGNHGEANLIIDHADVIMKVVENGCEYIVPQIPMEKINSVTMRSIINDLIKAENWTMALELSVKFDTSGKIGVFSAWGVSAIKNGKYKLAREKISLAIQQVQGSSIESNERFLSMLTSNEKIDDFNFNYRRSNHGSPLLTEILEALELTASKRKPFQHDELIEESIGIEIEPNIDVIVKNEKTNDEWETNDVIESPYFEESMYYLIKYGGDADILQFLMRNNLIPSALRFVQSQKIQSELFIQYVFVPLMRVDKMESLIKYLRKLDPRFIEWKTYLIHTCKYLEKKKAFNSLYQMQTNVGDRIRAALTCIDFYCDGVKNYTELHSKASHLNEAKSHLLTELEKVEWMSKEVLEKSGKDELILKWDLKTINTTINIISLQLEIAKYLADCESNNLKTTQLMKKIFNEKQEVRTLFGKSNERTQVAILVLICGKSIETGYGISYR